MEHVLQGLRVLDLTRALAGPSCTRMLAEMGADVIKVEPAPTGDLVRRISVFRGGRSLYYVQQNRGKKSVCLNLRDPRGIALLAELARKVDVVVENFRPGVIRDLGLGYERLREFDRKIILCSISALGQEGPLSAKPGYDYIAQAYSGITSMIGEPGDAPYIPLAGLGDVNTGVHGALAILAALRHRDRTGEGQHVQVSILDVYYHCHEVNVHAYTGTGGAVKPTRSGRQMTYVCPGGVFRATGGAVVIMAFLHHWADLCRAMDRADLIEDPAWADDRARLAHRDDVTRLIEEWLATFPDVASAVDRLEQFEVPVAPVLSIEETVHHPHHRARGTIRTVHDPVYGDVDLPGMPLRFSAFPEPLPLTAASLGEHNEEVLTSVLRRSPDDVRHLREEGVLVEKDG